MAVTGLRVQHTDGSTKTYPAARAYYWDGHGDLVMTGADGKPVATRRRGSVGDEVELLYSDTDGDTDGGTDTSTDTSTGGTAAAPESDPSGP